MLPKWLLAVAVDDTSKKRFCAILRKNLLFQDENGIIEQKSKAVIEPLITLRIFNVQLLAHSY